jgi:hypothetical protein
MTRARLLYRSEPNALDLDAPFYAIDSSLIDLSLALSPWANWTGTDGAVKLHTQLDLRGPLPRQACRHRRRAWRRDLARLAAHRAGRLLHHGSWLRGPLRRLRRLHQGGAFFVVRERDDVRRYGTQSRPVDRSKPLRSERTIRFCGEDFRKHWPDRCVASASST